MGQSGVAELGRQGRVQPALRARLLNARCRQQIAEEADDQRRQQQHARRHAPARWSTGTGRRCRYRGRGRACPRPQQGASPGARLRRRTAAYIAGGPPRSRPGSGRRSARRASSGRCSLAARLTRPPCRGPDPPRRFRSPRRCRSPFLSPILALPMRRIRCRAMGCWSAWWPSTSSQAVRRPSGTCSGTARLRARRACRSSAWGCRRPLARLGVGRDRGSCWLRSPPVTRLSGSGE